MKDIRSLFLEFLDEQELSGALTQASGITNESVKELRYLRIDRYDVSFLKRDQLAKIIEFNIQFHEYIDIYFAFGQLCIGYLDNQYGIQKRLVAFENHWLV